jgi:deoxyribose-phosphate aldolase
MLPKTEGEMARCIDQTNLQPEVTQPEMTAFLHRVRELGFASAAIMPAWVPLASQILAGTGIAVDSSIGFPLGTCTTAEKAAEARWSVANSPECGELDMVMNLSLFKSGRYKEVKDDIRAVVEAADGRIVKVIIEVPLLTPAEVVIASLLCEGGGAHFIKTSTGFKAFKGWRPSTVDDVRLIKSAVSDRMKIKIAGGIFTFEQAAAALQAGASRIGTARGEQILAG